MSRTHWIAGIVAVAAAFAMAACRGGDAANNLTEVQRLRSGDVDVVLLAEDGALNQGKDAFTIEFRSATSGNLVDVGTVTTSATMPMPNMSMPGNVEVTRSETPGRYQAVGEFGMAGGWQMRIGWKGPAGQGSVGFERAVQ